MSADLTPAQQYRLRCLTDALMLCETETAGPDGLPLDLDSALALNCAVATVELDPDATVLDAIRSAARTILSTQPDSDRPLDHLTTAAALWL